ncbi:hypothetical protein EVG20_g3469 [Dentipellis fragilis]|uniref:GST N-terminal domain-containing protein n=1 Tax=Dentipellis fragilis TaxID=205917 RepID=A0A4Y9Z1G5_9AGAM|nr:hypothetical protein EVG20_g3469 [Dentipellis fragilis]
MTLDSARNVHASSALELGEPFCLGNKSTDATSRTYEREDIISCQIVPLPTWPQLRQAPNLPKQIEIPSPNELFYQRNHLDDTSYTVGVKSFWKPRDVCTRTPRLLGHELLTNPADPIPQDFWYPPRSLGQLFHSDIMAVANSTFMAIRSTRGWVCLTLWATGQATTTRENIAILVHGFPRTHFVHDAGQYSSLLDYPSNVLTSPLATHRAALFLNACCDQAEIVFEEAGVQPRKYFIDLQNKPEWYLTKVNPAGKVPAIAYGGPKVSPENPSPESVKLAESLVLLEFAVDLYPNSGLSPKEPVDRARARLFIDRTSTVFTSLYAFMLRGGAVEALVDSLRNLQTLLPPGGGWALGSDFTFADAAVAPFIGRIEVYLRNDLGKYPVGQGPKLYRQLFEDAEFARLQQYWKDISARPSFKATYDEVSVPRSSCDPPLIGATQAVLVAHATAHLSRDAK